MQTNTVGLDLAKTVFQALLQPVDQPGEAVGRSLVLAHAQC
jgi:hypothetical protein